MKNEIPKSLLDALNENKDSIYVWVPITKTNRQSIRVSFSEAMEWVLQVSKSHKVVPFYIGNHEVFLGCMLNYV